jgi:peptide/nickel transport system substrate-binding protein
MSTGSACVLRDEDAMITALKTDQLDAINEIPPTSVATLKSAGMEVYQGEALALRDPSSTSIEQDREPRAAGPEGSRGDGVRDRPRGDRGDRLARLRLTGFDDHPRGERHPRVEWHDSSVQPLPYDPAMANEILDSLGYARGTDGIRIADGHPMEYEVVFPLDEAGAGDRAFRIMQQGFEEIGIGLIQKRFDTNAAWNAMYDNGSTSSIVWDWFPAADPDFILGVLTCISGATGTTPGTAPSVRRPVRGAEVGHRSPGAAAGRLPDAADGLRGSPVHHLDVRHAPRRLVAEVGGFRPVRPGDLQQLLDAEPHVGASGVVIARSVM